MEGPCSTQEPLSPQPEVLEAPEGGPLCCTCSPFRSGVKILIPGLTPLHSALRTMWPEGLHPGMSLCVPMTSPQEPI